MVLILSVPRRPSRIVFSLTYGFIQQKDTSGSERLCLGCSVQNRADNAETSSLLRPWISCPLATLTVLAFTFEVSIRHFCFQKCNLTLHRPAKIATHS